MRVIVWCVWTESDEYEQFSRDLRGVFATEELAKAHADQVRREADACEVVAEEVREDLPVRVPFIRWAAHIHPDGTEDRELGFCRGKQFDTWSNEIATVSGRLAPWTHRGAADLYIEVIGSDAAAVKAEYERLLTVARGQLRAGLTSDDAPPLARERATDA